MYILFEHLWEYDRKEVNIVAIFEDIDKINAVLSSEDIIEIREEYTGKTVVVRNNRKYGMHRELSIVKAKNNSIVNKTVAI